MLEEAIEFMAGNSDRSLDDPEIMEYRNIVEENKYDPKIKEILSKQFRPTSVSIGTAGSYLWGCSQNYYGNVSKTCSPLCSEGIGYQPTTCQYQIWTYDGELKTNGEIYSSQAYIYVSKNWQGFNISDIEILKSYNVLFASIFETIDSKHNLIIPMTSIENLPLIKKKMSRKKDEDASYSKLYLFIFLCFLIIAYYSFNKKFSYF